MRDSFFASLMVLDSDAPDYLDELSTSYYKNAVQKKEFNIPKNYYLSRDFSSQIGMQLLDHIIKDKIDSLHIGKDGTYVLSYITSIKIILYLIKQDSINFSIFKQQFLLGLITRYVNDYASGYEKDITRLSKLIGVYAEYARELESVGDIPMIIDEKYINDVREQKNKGIISDKKSLVLLIELLNRAYPKNSNNLYEEFLLKSKKYIN